MKLIKLNNKTRKNRINRQKYTINNSKKIFINNKNKKIKKGFNTKMRFLNKFQKIKSGDKNAYQIMIIIWIQ